MTDFRYVFNWLDWFNDAGTPNQISENAGAPTQISGAGSPLATGGPNDPVTIGAYVEVDADGDGIAENFLVTENNLSGSGDPTGVSNDVFGADEGHIKLAMDAPSGQGTDREQVALNLVFENTDPSGAPGVSGLSFQILDVDQNNFFRDQVQVQVFDTDGNLVDVDLVTLTAINPANVAIDSVNDIVTGQSGSNIDTTSDQGNVIVTVDDSVQVGRVRLLYTAAQPGSNPNSNTFYQAIGVSDLTYTADVSVGIFDDTDPGAPSAGIDDGTVFGTDNDDIIFGGLSSRGDPGALNDDTFPDDTMEGRGGNDTIYAGIGDDTVSGGTGGDLLYAGEDNDTLYGDDGTDTLYGEAGDDTLYGGSEVDTLYGGAGNDTLYGGLDTDTLIGGDGSDTLFGDESNDTLEGGVGLDVLYGGTQNDSLSGGLGGDVLYGGSGVDQLLGESGADTLFGGSGIDLLQGGSGTDTLDGGAGNDFVFGGSGSDVHSLLANGDTDQIVGGEDAGDTDIDVIRSDGSEGLNVVFTGAESGSATVSGTTATFVEIERVELTDEGDTVDGSPSSEALTIDGLGGNDTLTGSSNDDILYGGDDDDILIGGDGDDTLYGGDGEDDITVGGGDTAFGGLENDDFTIGGADGTPIFIDGNEDPDNSDIDTLDIRGLTAQNGQPLQLSDITFVPGSGNEDGSFVLQDGTVVVFQNIERIICFAAGTLIDTPEGPRPVEELAEGDLVVTRDGDAKPIRWAGRREVPALGPLAPIRIAAGALGNDRALTVSPMHRMLVADWRAELLFGSREVLVAAKHLVDGDRIVRVEGGTVEYVHILFDQHEIVFANGAPAESFHPGHVGLDAIEQAAREELLSIFPELRDDLTAYGPTVRPALKAFEARALLR